MKKRTVIGTNIANFRKEKGITQKQLAEALGKKVQTVSKWEQGISYPEVMLFPQIAAYFRISIDEIFNGRKVRKKRAPKKAVQEESIAEEIVAEENTASESKPE
ncbi:MAG: helix-turn-helix transcriptional regulator [Ruminococcaceae bacterium]|nr:helix-turn-helix transcriptional regulator [Oscillospiraceae bacterium]